MKNNQSVLTILLIIFNATLMLGQQDDCPNCPNCAKRLIDGQKTLNEAKNQLEAENKDYKRRLSNVVDKSELDKAKSESNRFLSENQSLLTQLSDGKNTVQNLNDEIAKLKAQLGKKAEEANTYKSETDKQKEEIENKKKEVKRLEGSQAGDRGILCITPWLNDRISKTQNKIAFYNDNFNFILYDKGDMKSELCFISFQGNTTNIKEIKVGTDVLTDPDGIKCLLNRINNLFYHYQDVLYLRFHVKYKDGKTTAAKEQFSSIQNFFRIYFASDRKNEAAAGDVEFKKYTIAKWSRGDIDGISISISANSENSDDELKK